MSSTDVPPSGPLSARSLILRMVVRFAREHDGDYDLVAGTVTGLKPLHALALAGGLHELGCPIRVELPLLAQSLVTYELPPGA